MSKTLTFYTNPMSRGQIIRWMLEETGAEYVEKVVEYGPEMKSGEYLAINPMGKVPAIKHGDAVVTECAAICAYLADAFPEAGLAPSVDQRADYYRWLFFAAGPVESATTNKSLGFETDEQQQRMAGFGTYDLTMQVLDDLVGSRDYVCGDRFTAADVYVGSQIDFGLLFGSITATDNFNQYAERLRERPAYKAAKQKDMALMPETK
ncbi:MAG: glutathione S-transferase family protein [Pseudomonadota bacterium]